MARQQLTLTELARVGFVDLGEVRPRLGEVHALGGPEAAELLSLLRETASPDAALGALLALLRQAPGEVRALLAERGRDPPAAARCRRVERPDRVLPPASRRAHRARRLAHVAARPGRTDRRPAGLRRGRGRLRDDRRRGGLGRPAGALPPAARGTRGLRPRAGRCRRRRRRGGPHARRPGRRGPGGLTGGGPEHVVEHGRRPRRLPRRGGPGDPAGRGRHGEGGRERTELRQRRRRDLRRGGRRGRRARHRAGGRHRHPAGDPDDARNQRSRDRAGTVGGRSEPPARGQGRGPGPVAGIAPRVLRPVGEELGVPGPAQGPAARRRPRPRRPLRRGGRPHGVDQRQPRQLRRIGAAHAGTGDQEHPRRRGRRAAQARPGRPPGHRIHRAAAPARARPGRPRRSAVRHAAGPGGAGRRRVRRAGGGGRVRPGLPHAAADGTPAAAGEAPAHPPRAARRGEPAHPGQGHRAGDERRAADRPLGGDQAARPWPARAALLPPVARRGGGVAGGGAGPDQRAGRGAALRDRFPGREGGPRPHRRAHRRGVAPGGDPAAPAPGHAELVLGGGGPGLRPAGLPPAERQPGVDLLVPADAARLLRRRPAPDPRALRLAFRRRAAGEDPRGRRLAGRRRRPAPPAAGVAAGGGARRAGAP